MDLMVTVSLDVLLITLLLAAIAYGVRLERRLKALRDGHQVFAQAVRELDQSVLRAEAGLDQLRRAGEEARDGLHDRILKAREASTELERMLARAERLKSQPQIAPQISPQTAPPAAPAARRPEPRPEARPEARPEPRPEARPEPRLRAPTRGEAAAERVAQAILNLDPAMLEDEEEESDVLELSVPARRPELRRPEPREPLQLRPDPKPEPELQFGRRPARRPRSAADEDLFEAPPAPVLRRADGGRR